MADNIKLAEFDIDIDDVVKSAQELKRAIDDIKKSQADARKEGRTSDAQYVENEASLKALNSEYRKHIGIIQQNIEATAQATNREELLNAALSQEVTTIEEAREQNKLLSELRNQANATTTEGQEEITKLNNALDANNDFIKDNVDALSKQKINVGNYSESIKGALGSMNPFNQSISVFVSNVQSAGGATQFFSKSMTTLTTAIGGVIKASLAFLATPIGAVIGAIGLVLGLVVNSLRSTQAGMDKVTAVTRPLTAVFEVLVGVLQDIGTFLIEAFSNPLETMEKVYNYVKDKIVKQFEALTNVVQGIFTFDFDQIKKGFDQFAQVAKDTMADVANATGEFVDRIKEGVRLGQELDRLMKELEETQIRNAELLPDLNARLREANLIARDTNKTTQEREVSAKEALRLTKEINELKKEELGLEIAIAENEAARNDTSREDQLEIAKLKGKLRDSDAQAAQEQVRLQQNLVAIQKEAIAQQQKAIDEQINKQKELLDLFIAEQGERARTLQEELELEESTRKQREEILKAELKNKKISQDAYAAELIRIDEDLARRRAEIAADNAMREIEANRMALERQREDSQFLTQQLAEDRKGENNEILRQEKLLAEKRLEDGLINQQEFDDAIRELTEANRIANKELDDERAAIERQEAIEQRAIDFEQELARLEEEGASKFEIEQERIRQQRAIQEVEAKQQRDDQIISEELYQSRLNQISEQARRADLANEKALAEQKLSITQNILGQISSLIGKESAAGKAVAIAQSLINTYQGITSALKAPWPLSIPAVATAALTGFKAVSDIVKTDPMKASGATTNAGSVGADMVQSTRLTGVNAGQIAASGNAVVQQQIQESAQQTGLSDAVGNAVREGAREGTSTGSQEGITNLSDNRDIQRSSTF